MIVYQAVICYCYRYCCYQAVFVIDIVIVIRQLFVIVIVIVIRQLFVIVIRQFFVIVIVIVIRQCQRHSTGRPEICHSCLLSFLLWATSIMKRFSEA